MLMNPRWSLEDDSLVFHKRVCLESVEVENGVSIFHNSSNFMMCEIIYTQTFQWDPATLFFISTVKAVEAELMHYGV